VDAKIVTGPFGKLVPEIVICIPAGPRCDVGLTIWIEPGCGVDVGVTGVEVGVFVGVSVGVGAAGIAKTDLRCSGPPRPKRASQTALSSSADAANPSAAFLRGGAARRYCLPGAVLPSADIVHHL
jgi:hypothetical protein